MTNRAARRQVEERQQKQMDSEQPPGPCYHTDRLSGGGGRKEGRMIKQISAKGSSFAAVGIMNCPLGRISSKGRKKYLLKLVHAKSEPAVWNHTSC